MDVILSANVPHYLYTARALNRAGFLKRYICAIGIKHGRPLPSFLPQFWRKKLQGRRIQGVPNDRAVTLWLPELLQKGLPQIGLISSEDGNWVNNHLYDWLASRYVERCDIFHFMNSVGLYSGRKAKAMGATLLCDVREEHLDFQRRILIEEYRRLGITAKLPLSRCAAKVKAELSLADYFIVPSSYAKNTFVEEGIEPHKIFVVPYGFDPEQFYPLPKNDDIFRVLFVGGLIPRKGIQYLLEAFTQVNLPNAKLLLIGPWDPRLQRIIRTDNSITHIPNVPKVELFRYYSNASVFVLPSVADAQPLVVLEAMACGLPVIVSKHCGSTDFVREGIDGFIIPIRDVGTLKDRLHLLYKDEGKRQQMGHEARNRIRQFTWESYGKRIIEVYDEIATRQGLRQESETQR